MNKDTLGFHLRISPSLEEDITQQGQRAVTNLAGLANVAKLVGIPGAQLPHNQSLSIFYRGETPPPVLYDRQDEPHLEVRLLPQRQEGEGLTTARITASVANALSVAEHRRRTPRSILTRAALGVIAVGAGTGIWSTFAEAEPGKVAAWGFMASLFLGLSGAFRGVKPISAPVMEKILKGPHPVSLDRRQQ